jgi:acetyl-CoA synthetase
MPGIHPIIYDDEGKWSPGCRQGRQHLHPESLAGHVQTIWGDRDRFVDTYFARYCKDPNSKDWRDWPYLTGDAAVKAEDGYYRILGRIDDVINVSGHRLGTKEIESAALVVEEVAEAAVVPVTTISRARNRICTSPSNPDSRPVTSWPRKSDAVCTEIGKIAKPRKVWIVKDMPKTRSGKIMRRVLGAISNNRDVGDVMTLANPEIVEEIKKWSRNNFQ